MEAFLESWKNVALWEEILLKLVLAAVAGGLVGLEREFHGRAAGLRTHMLVCVSAAITAIVGLFLAEYMNELGLSTDVQRTGAQVMSGIGFLGAGTILLKKGSSHITGLTTAAGLWATAAIGLAVGYGIYAGAIIGVAVVVLAFTLMSRVEFSMKSKSSRNFFYVELDTDTAVKATLQTLSEDFHAVELQVTPARSGISGHVGVEALIRIKNNGSVKEEIDLLCKIDHVIFSIVVP